MELVLHILSISFGTWLNIWIFSKLFPRREDRRWQESLNEILYCNYILLIILHNFAEKMHLAEKGLLMVLLTGAVLFLRCIVERGMRGRRQIAVWDTGIACVELGAGLGLFIWNAWGSYISVPTIILGNYYMPFFLCRYFRCSWLQGYLWEVLYEATTQIIRGSYMVYL